jgi:RHS repeat-associated protein
MNIKSKKSQTLKLFAIFSSVIILTSIVSTALPNIIDGNLYISENDMSIKGRGFNIDINRIYNSNKSNFCPNCGSAGFLGSGWQFLYNIKLQTNDDETISLYNGDGSVYTFFNDAYLNKYISMDTDSELIQNQDGSFTLVFKDGTKYNFASSGTLLNMVDRNGNKLTFSYTAGKLTKVADDSGTAITLNYDSKGRISSASDPLNRQVTYEYDTNNNLLKVINPSGDSTQYRYDQNNLLNGITDPLGKSTNIEYSDGRAASMQTSLSNISYQYDEQGRVTVMTEFVDGNIFTTRYLYDDDNHTEKIIDPLGNTVSTTRNFSLNISIFTDENGHETRYYYDANGNLEKVVDALGSPTYYTYENTFSQIKSITDTRGYTWNYQYDSKGNLIEDRDPLGNSIFYSYDSFGYPVKIQFSTSNITYQYDSHGNLISQVDALGNFVNNTYDAVSNLNSTTDPNGNTITYTYDQLDRITSISDPLGRKISFSYDSNGNMVGFTDAKYKATGYDYDSFNRLTKYTDALGSETKYAYDGHDNLKILTNSKGKNSTFTYDPLDRLLTETDALGHTTGYTYDAAGNLISRTDPNGATTLFAYDALDRVIKIDYPDDSDVYYAYDTMGNVISIRNKYAVLNYTYDALNRVTKVEDTTSKKSISYSYDAQGNVVSMTDQDGGVTTYEYDAANQLISLTNPLKQTTRYSYDKAGRITEKTYHNGIRANYTYDQANQLLSIKYLNSSNSVVSGYAYEYDENGNIVKMVEADGNETRYGYDAINQLINVTYPDGSKVEYTYDAMGNRMVLKNPAGSTNYTYDDIDRLQKAGQASYKWDSNGNLISKTDANGTTTYSYNYEDKLVQITFPDGTTNKFTYYPDGRRLSKTDRAGNTTYFYYDGDNMVLEKDELGNTVARYTSGLDVDDWISMNREGDSYFYIKDRLGSVTGLADSNQYLANRYKYDAFGDIIETNGNIVNPYLYTGREYDEESRLFYYRARYYDSEMGRFISKDPVKDRKYNPYSYVNNNPISLVDPYGDQPISDSLKSLWRRWLNMPPIWRDTLLPIALSIIILSIPLTGLAALSIGGISFLTLLGGALGAISLIDLGRHGLDLIDILNDPCKNPSEKISKAIPMIFDLLSIVSAIRGFVPNNWPLPRFLKPEWNARFISSKNMGQGVTRYTIKAEEQGLFKIMNYYSGLPGRERIFRVPGASIRTPLKIFDTFIWEKAFNSKFWRSFFSTPNYCNEKTINSANKEEEIKNVFRTDEDIFAKYSVYSSKDYKTPARIYVVKVDDTNSISGPPLTDITDDDFDVIVLEPKQPNGKIKNIWPAPQDGENPVGRYTIVLDMNLNGNYDENIDIIDPDGFVIAGSYCALPDSYSAMEGKGVWVNYSDKFSFMNDLESNTNILKSLGVTHLIFPIINNRTLPLSDFHWYSSYDLPNLLPLAHDNGLKVLGWAKVNIENPTDRDYYVNQFLIAKDFQIGNDKLDGLIADIEFTESTNPTFQDIRDFSDGIRNQLPKEMLFVVSDKTYKFINEDISEDAPYAIYDQEFNITSSRIFWNNGINYRPGPEKVYTEVGTSIVKLRELGGINLSIVSQIAFGEMQNGLGGYIPDKDEVAANLRASRDQESLGTSFWYYGGQFPESSQKEAIKSFDWPTSIDIYNFDSFTVPQERLHLGSPAFSGGGVRASGCEESKIKKERYVDGQFRISGIPIHSFVNDRIRLEGDEYVEYRFNDSINSDLNNINNTGLPAREVYLLLTAINGLRTIKYYTIGKVEVDFTDGDKSTTDLILGKNIRNNYNGTDYVSYVTELEDPNAGWSWKSVSDEFYEGMLRIDIPPGKNITAIRISSVPHGAVWYSVKPAIQLSGITIMSKEVPPQILPPSSKKAHARTSNQYYYEALLSQLYSFHVAEFFERSIAITMGQFLALHSSLSVTIGNEQLLIYKIDPPDSKFQEIADPVFPEINKINYSDDFPHNMTDQMNAELESEAKVLGYTQAFYTSTNRYSTAVSVKDSNSIQLQRSAIKNYTDLIAISLQKNAEDINNLSQTWQDIGLPNPNASVEDIAGYQSNLSQSGFSNDLMEAFARLNATPEEIEEAKTLMVSIEPSNSATDLLTMFSRKEKRMTDLSEELTYFSNNFTVHPFIVSTFPSDVDRNVLVKTNVSIVFSEDMYPDSINSGSIKLEDINGTAVPAIISYDPISKTATLIPSKDLNYSTTYRANITTEAMNNDGLPMSDNFMWFFTTEFEPDRNAPATTILIDPSSPNGLNGWYITNVTINLTATDESAINYTEYSFDEVIWNNYTNPLNITEEGTTTIFARSYDNLGNREDPPKKSTVKIDRTPPVSTSNLSGQTFNGTYTRNITVTLSATDNFNGSGVNATLYSLDGGINWNVYANPFMINNPGIVTIHYKSTDNASNVEDIKSIKADINNPPPILDHINDIVVNETSLIHITLTASDPENDPLTFTFSPPLNSSGMWQTTYDDAGEYITRVTVTDGFSSVSQDVKITVLNVNRPPVLSPIGSLSAVEGSYFSYNVSASDPDNDQLTYSDDSPLFDINPFTGEIGFVPRFAGNHSFNISVSDGAAAVSQEVFLEVRNTNSPPEIEFIFPQIAIVGSNFSLLVNASDPDGDKLMFSDDTEIFDINAATGRIEFTPDSGQTGTYFINITVTDGIETDYAVLNLVVISDKPLELQPIQDIIAYAGDLIKIIANATYG